MLVVLFWAMAALPVGLIGFPWTLISGKIDLMYGLALHVARAGVRIAGVKVEVFGRETLDPKRNYIFMSNHVSNLDPPLLLPLIPRRTSVLVKKQLFRIPLLGQAMRLGDLVPVDRANREAAIASMRAAAEVVHRGLSLMIYPEGTRSPDGRLLPFKKGPFHLARDTGARIVPITIVGAHEVWPKGKFAIRPGAVKVIFHDTIDPRKFSDHESLTKAVEAAVRSGLPDQYRN